MSRKSRKRIVGPGEDYERTTREQEYVALETELHAAWRDDQQAEDMTRDDLLDEAE